jgi:hypothetical protein
MTPEDVHRQGKIGGIAGSKWFVERDGRSADTKSARNWARRARCPAIKMSRPKRGF